ncbi:type III secretion system outer membrane ring subunit SctC [Achromobacter sp. UMC71]|uniref:type III secretion system outer membrane ring subunit SctC n=1 Tax=Achromobacter sp. UMC71 TaxID=1862320 RepID=UPI00271455E5|nr:type III secretion system outer membrane ring subunit SctC [Achromobacter sp. UMC71]MBB1625130.1 EscC/YscC/HrcC family type III secretion system outer membrane ring protein [Achromobacter sp. UMC71]
MILATALSLGLTAGAQAAPNWPNVPYSYYAREENLQTLLREFAGGFSLSLQIGPNVTGTVNGKFNANTPTEFLDRLGGVYGFNWFVYAGTLFVSRTNDMKTRSVSAMGSSISALRQALQQLGVLDPRFGWGELPDQGIALVSGPPGYVDLVERTVAALPMGAGGQQVAVFRLKHASVNDRTISYRDQKVVTPGLSTVLRNLITGGGGGANNETLAAIAAPLRDNPPAFPQVNGGGGGGGGGGDGGGAGAQGSQAAAPAAPGKSGLRLREPTVQADARLNAIIVQDIPDRIPIYRSLIEQLDLPSTLVEIEAMIVDVNSDLVSELGVTWGARAGSTSFGYGNLGLGPSGGLPLESGAALSPGTIGISVGNTLAARLRALQTKGQANILSQPSILTADNLGAMIDLSDTFYIQTRGERVATVTPVTVGTSLRVTPRHIEAKSGSRVELTVDIEDGRIQEERQIDNLPTVRKSNISTLAIVGNDQTLLIGGYNSSQNSEQVDKVPILGDIPGLGILFSNKSKTVQRRERLFLIRPKVVAINGEAVATPGAAGTGPMLNATWGSDGRMTAGQYLDLAQSQRTRILFGPNVELRRVSGPVRPSEWLQGTPTADPVATPVLEGTSNARQGPVIQIEPVAAPGTGRAP